MCKNEHECTRGDGGGGDEVARSKRRATPGSSRRGAMRASRSN